MPRYSVPDDFRSHTLSELEGQLLAIKPDDINNEARDKFNVDQTKLAVFGDCWRIHDDATVEEIGRLAVYQVRPARALAATGIGNWFVGRPERREGQWEFQLDRDEEPRADKALDVLDPDPDTKPKPKPKPKPDEGPFA